MNITEHPLPGHGSRTPWGIMFHTTGGGLADKTLETGRSPLEQARVTYGGMKEGPHYFIAPDGSVERYRDPTQVAWHVGVSAENRRDFLTGHWENIVPRRVVTWWKERWPGVSSPQHLYPSTSPNQDYIGIEMMPCMAWTKGSPGSLKPVFGQPVSEKGRFTGAQYVAAASLSLLLSTKYSIPLDKRGRLVGHEDANPITRPGWDPGSYQGYWDWKVFWSVLEGLRLHAV